MRTSLGRRFGKFRIGRLNLKRNPAGDVRSEPLNETKFRATSGGVAKNITAWLNNIFVRGEKSNEIGPGVAAIAQGCTTL
jgi:hypothetical protein